MIELSAEQMTLLKKFKRCVDEYSIEKMDKKLYHFFMYECGFIAHYSIYGFREEYSGKDFLRWFQVFAEPNWMFFIPDNEYNNLRKLCAEYAKEKATSVYEHFARLERNKKIQQFHTLSKELGIAVAKNEDNHAAYLYKEEANGQFSLFS